VSDSGPDDSCAPYSSSCCWRSLPVGRRSINRNFEAVYRAGKALQVAVEQSGGVGSDVPDLLTKFQTEVATLDGRTRGEREAAALTKYREAADAYQFLLRLRALDFEAVNGRVLLAGTNLEAATRYGLAVEDVQTNGTLGRYGWSNRRRRSRPSSRLRRALSTRPIGL
jgi:hypothetical protein